MKNILVLTLLVFSLGCEKADVSLTEEKASDDYLTFRTCYTVCDPIIAWTIWCRSDYGWVDAGNLPDDCDEGSASQSTVGFNCHLECTLDTGSGGSSGGTGGFGSIWDNVNSDNSGNNNNSNPPPTPPCQNDPIGGNLRIAPTAAGGPYGGTFGCTRKDKITTCSAPPFNKQHDGVDIFAWVGDTVFAQYDGWVTLTGYNKTCGNWIVAEFPNAHGDFIKQTYCHLSKIDVVDTQQIMAGDNIGLVGKTGNASNPSIVPHVHIVTRKKDPATGDYGDPIDPLWYFGTQFNYNTLSFPTGPC